jgi:hypothetical protein
MINVAFALFKSLKNKTDSDVRNAIMGFGNYLEHLNRQNSPKRLKPTFIYHWTFKNRITNAVQRTSKLND